MSRESCFGQCFALTNWKFTYLNRIAQIISEDPASLIHLHLVKGSVEGLKTLLQVCLDIVGKFLENLGDSLVANSKACRIEVDKVSSGPATVEVDLGIILAVQEVTVVDQLARSDAMAERL
ncbi:hypothetical protein HG531_008655 [Fusarium graminearum]|nr:hypothetical protein HG531_008655 [Fusarium graminearum]